MRGGAVALAALVVTAPSDSAAGAIRSGSVVRPPEPALYAIAFDEAEHDRSQLGWSPIAVLRRNLRGTNVGPSISLAIGEVPKETTEQFADRDS